MRDRYKSLRMSPNKPGLAVPGKLHRSMSGWMTLVLPTISTSDHIGYVYVYVYPCVSTNRKALDAIKLIHGRHAFRDRVRPIYEVAGALRPWPGGGVMKSATIACIQGRPKEE